MNWYEPLEQEISSRRAYKLLIELSIFFRVLCGETLVAATTRSNEIVTIEDQYQLATYKKMPALVAESGEGVWIYTNDGERYLDLLRGGHAVAGTGHCHPQMR